MLFLQKNEKFFERWGLCPQTPILAPPPLRISGYAPVQDYGETSNALKRQTKIG